MKKLLLLLAVISTSIIQAQEGFTYNGKKLYPEKFTKTKNNAFASGLTYGLAKIKMKSYMTKPRARMNVPEKAEFKLTIKQTAGSTIQIGQFWGSVQSPEEFVLVKFNEHKRKGRWLETGSGNIYTGLNFSVDPKYYINFEWDENDDGTFTVRTQLKKGQYAFLYAGQNNAYANQSVYSFGVN
jgi:hypothetical protein